MGSKSAPSTPDYTPIAQADEKIANQDYQLQEQQLDWAKQQYANEEPQVQQYLSQQTAASAEQNQIATNQENYYLKTYQPIETQFANTAQNYDSADNANQQAGAAEGAVATNADAARAAATQNLESYGIDPSQTRYGALDLGSQISQAEATAAAGTQSRLNTQMTGLQLESQAINTGRGYSNSVAQSFSGAANSGASGFGAYNSSTATNAGAMTGSTAFGNQGISANSGAAGAMNMGYQDALGGAQLNSQNTWNTLGALSNLAGGALGYFSGGSGSN